MMLASKHICSNCALPPTRARSYEELAYALKYNKVRRRLPVESVLGPGAAAFGRKPDVKHHSGSAAQHPQVLTQPSHQWPDVLRLQLDLLLVVAGWHMWPATTHSKDPLIII